MAKLNVNAFTVNFLLMILLILKCDTFIGEDDELTMTRTSYNGTELRLDGYYTAVVAGSTEGNRVFVLCLYQNGIMFGNSGTWPEKDLDELETSFANGSYYQKWKDHKYMWGVFQVEDSSITIQKWRARDGAPMYAMVLSGEILNNTTFVLTEEMRVDGTEKEVAGGYYRFKQFSPKPDSTSPFIP